VDNFLCTNDMSLHTIGHSSEAPLAHPEPGSTDRIWF
jgi:hypothetical protein